MPPLPHTSSLQRHDNMKRQKDFLALYGNAVADPLPGTRSLMSAHAGHRVAVRVVVDRIDRLPLYVEEGDGALIDGPGD